MADLSLVSKAAWCEARRLAEVIRPLAKHDHRKQIALLQMNLAFR